MPFKVGCGLMGGFCKEVNFTKGGFVSNRLTPFVFFSVYSPHAERHHLSKVDTNVQICGTGVCIPDHLVATQCSQTFSPPPPTVPWQLYQTPVYCSPPVQWGTSLHSTKQFSAAQGQSRGEGEKPAWSSTGH